MRVVAMFGVFLFGCSAKSTVGNENNRGSVIEADGRYAFYSGRGTGDALADGRSIEDSTYPMAFMRLRVPSALVDEALATPSRVLTSSFEVPNGSIEATVHTLESGSGQAHNFYFHPGDPWLSGYAQVGAGSDNVTLGLFEVIKWNRDSSGTMPNLFAQDIETTGLLPDEARPTLKYADNLTSAPLPENWK